MRLNNTCDIYLIVLDIQKNFPHLTSLEYSSKNFLDEIVKNIWKNPANRILNSNLKRLKLRTPSVPVNYVRYITDYIPIQADTLELYNEEVDLYDRIDDFGMGNALKFANRLSCKNRLFYCTKASQQVPNQR